MCMSNMRTTDLDKESEVAWKVLSYSRGDRKWYTPYMYESIRYNKLKAEGKPEIFKSGRKNMNSRGNVNFQISELNGGAIHCYITREEAYNSIKGMKKRAVFKVIGKNPIARNWNQIAFEEIKFIDTINDWEI